MTRTEGCLQAVPMLELHRLKVLVHTLRADAILIKAAIMLLQSAFYNHE